MGRERTNGDEGRARLPRMMAIGVGGGGSNAVERMAEEGLVGVELVAVNTDLQALRRCRVPARLAIGHELTRGHGVGGEPERGRRAALEDLELLQGLLSGVDMVFLATGLGGGTGTGAAPVIAALAVRLGVLTVAVATLPFAFEGRRRRRHAERGLDELGRVCDIYLAIENEKLLEVADPGWPLDRAFALSDEILHRGVEGLSDLLATPGEINIDFADVRAIMARRGRAVLGIGTAEGEGRAERAARAAVSSPLVADTSLEGARSVLVNISGGHDLTLHEVSEAAGVIQDAVEDDAEVVTGMVLDERFAGEVRVTAVVTGFPRPEEQWRSPPDDPLAQALELALSSEKEEVTRGPEQEEREEPRKGGLLSGSEENGKKPRRGGPPREGVGRGGLGFAPDPEPAPGVAVDQVYFTVTAPRSLERGASFLLDVWAHTRDQRQEVLDLAREQQEGEIRTKTKGAVSLVRGTELVVRVKIDGLEVDDPQDTIGWQGEIGNASFPVRVPEAVATGSARGLATIHAGGLQVAKVHFILQVARRPGDVGKIPSWESRHRRAFASYSSRDRDAVLGRLQGMQKIAPGLEIFLDVLTLRSGQYWEQELWREIPRSDVFYLFWSQHARASRWVEKEWRCALQSKGLDFIDPVPLVPPEIAPPPEELGSKHFNDWTLAFARNRPAAG